MIDRTLQPPLYPITKINFVEPTIIPINSFVDWAHHRVLEFEHNYNNL